MLESLALGDIDTHPYWTLKPSEIWASDERFKEYPKDTVVNSIRRYRKSISLHKKVFLLKTMLQQNTLRNFVDRQPTIGAKQNYTITRQSTYWSWMLLQVEQTGGFRKIFNKIARSTRISM